MCLLKLSYLKAVASKRLFRVAMHQLHLYLLSQSSEFRCHMYRQRRVFRLFRESLQSIRQTRLFRDSKVAYLSGELAKSPHLKKYLGFLRRPGVFKGFFQLKEYAQVCRHKRVFHRQIDTYRQVVLRKHSLLALVYHRNQGMKVKVAVSHCRQAMLRRCYQKLKDQYMLHEMHRSGYYQQYSCYKLIRRGMAGLKTHVLASRQKRQNTQTLHNHL